MTDQLTLTIGVSLLCGIALGLAYFALLYQTVRLHTTNAALQSLLPLYLLRLGLAVGVFAGLAQYGVWSPLAGLTGFLIARQGAKYLVRRP